MTRIVLAACLLAACGGSSEGDYECTGDELTGTWEAAVQGRDDCSDISGTILVKWGEGNEGCETTSEMVDACTLEREEVCEDGSKSISVLTVTGPREAVEVVTLSTYDRLGLLVDVCTADVAYRRP